MIAWTMNIKICEISVIFGLNYATDVVGHWRLQAEIPQKGAALETTSNFSLLYQQIVEKKAMRIKKIISLGAWVHWLDDN